MLFTFVVAIGVLWIYDKGVANIKNFITSKNYLQLLYGISLFAITGILIVVPEVMSFMIKGFYIEYGMLGLALVLLFHIFKDNSPAVVLSITILYLLHGIYRVALWNSAYSSMQFWNNLFGYKYIWSKLDVKYGLTQLQRYYFNAWGVLSLIPILLLESFDLSHIKLNKFVGYIFYPAHMTLLIIITIILKVI